MAQKKILIVQNILHEGPGILQNLLREENIAFEILEMDEGKEFPSLREYGAIVVCGGPDSANDTTDKMKRELQGIREAIKQHLPYLGICLGMQALVKAAGGRVMKHTVKEIGFRDPVGKFFELCLTEKGKIDPLFSGLPSVLRVFHLHGETVDLAPGIQLLGEGKLCRHQAVKVGEKAYGLQCHFELTDEMFAIWLKKDPDLKELPLTSLQQDYALIQTEYQSTGVKLFRNFLAIAGY